MSSGEATAGPMATGAQLLDALRARPGGNELLALTRSEAMDMALVGGAVRDLLLGRSPRELDVVVAGDAAQLAGELAAGVQAGTGESAETTAHERFGTAVVEWAGGRV